MLRRLLDTHVHVWESGHLRLPWLDGVPPLNRDWTPSDWMAALPPLESVGAVYLEVDVAPEDRQRELECVAGLLADPASGFVSAVVHGDPTSEDLPEWIRRCEEVPGVRGCRSVLHTPDQPRGLCLIPPFIAGLRLLGRHDLHFELCMRHQELSDAAELARQVPGTSLVLDHLGNPPIDGRDLAGWRDDLARLAEQPNVWCKVSGLFQNVSPGWTREQMDEVIDHARSCFGIDRLMFGGNWPVCTLAGSLESWLEIVDGATSQWGPSDRMSLFADTGAKFYRVD